MYQNEFELPSQVLEIIELLNAYQYQAYIAGPCVRELIRGERPMDYDIITDAQTQRIKKIFKDYPINDKRENKGELIIMVKGMAIMVSPFIAYFDGNNPVTTLRITEDLARRDFTANAIAYSPQTGFVDPFGGIECLKGENVKLIAIGEDGHNPFSDYKSVNRMINLISSIIKNPVNILTALKYYSDGGFEISETTAANMRQYADSIKIFPDKLMKEWFERVLMGRNSGNALIEFKEIFFIIFPELKEIDNFEQQSKYHDLTLYEHVCKAVGVSSPNKIIRYALLFHGLGKPDCEGNEAGCDYKTFYGHAERGAILAERILTRMEISDEQKEQILFIIRYHDYPLCQITEDVKRALEEMQPTELRMLLLAQAANLRAKKNYDEIVVQNLKRLADSVFKISGEIVSYKNTLLF